jgi:conjugative relaxase-like TrwC/TraI family protein
VYGEYARGESTPQPERDSLPPKSLRKPAPRQPVAPLRTHPQDPNCTLITSESLGNAKTDLKYVWTKAPGPGCTSGADQSNGLFGLSPALSPYMSVQITRIREQGKGASASDYSAYVLGAEETLAPTEAKDITADHAAEAVSAYATYAKAEREAEETDRETTLWVGRQAEEWGLTGGPVLEKDLTAMLNQHNPATGEDLDGARVRRLERHAEKVVKYEAAKERWSTRPELFAQAAAFAALIAAVEQAGELADTNVSALVQHHLGTTFTERQVGLVLAAARGAADRKQTLAAAIRSQQVQMKLVEPAYPRVSEAPSNTVIGYDLTLTCTGAESELLKDPVLREAAVGCAQRAGTRTLKVLEEMLTAGRTGKGGRDRHEVAGIAAAMVTHFTSRPAGDPPLEDPSLHIHAVIGARVRLPDGTWCTLDSRTWFQAKTLLQSIYDGETRAELTAELGVAWRQRETTNPITQKKSQHWEMVITGDDERDDRLIDHFARRTAEITEEVERRKAAGERVNKNLVWAATRNNKNPEKPLSECIEQWAQRTADFARAEGLDPETLLHGAIGRATEKERQDARESIRLGAGFQGPATNWLSTMSATERAAVIDSWTGYVAEEADLLAQRRATFGRKDLLVAVMKSAPPTISPSFLTAQVDAYITNVALEIVPVRATKDPTAWTEGRWTTGAQIDREWETLVILENLSKSVGADVSAETARLVLEEFANRNGALTMDQERFFLSVLRDGEAGRMVAVAAPAGAGKSHACTAIAQAHRIDHPNGQVMAIALASRAGTALSRDIVGGADFEGSLDRLLSHIEHGLVQLTPETLIFIDEASMAGSVKLQAVLKLIDESGARVALVGDPEQLDAPGQAGGLLHLLDAHGLTVRFADTVRNRDAEIRNAQLAWRSALESENEEAAKSTLSTWVNRDLVAVCDGEEEALDRAFAGWVAHHTATNEELAAWTVGHNSLVERANSTSRGPERDAANIAVEEHNSQKPDTAALLLAERHEAVARLSDRIQDYLVETGEIDGRYCVEARRMAPGTDELEPLVGSQGEDLSHTRLSRGLLVRVTQNSKSGTLEEQLEVAIVAAEAAYNGKREWESRMAWGVSPEVRAISAELKKSQMRNGDLCTVEHVHPATGEATLRVPGAKGHEDRLIRVSKSQLEEGLVVPAAGGTVTLASSQGRTTGWCGTVATQSTSADHLLMAMTRPRGDAELFFAADAELKDPRLVMWENDKRNAELEGEAFTKPAPTEVIPGLWQVAECWSRSDRSTLAYHEAEKDRIKTAEIENARKGTPDAEVLIDAFVMPGDRAEAAQLLGPVADPRQHAELAQTIANTRAKDEQALAKATQLRRDALQKTEGLARGRGPQR